MSYIISGRRTTAAGAKVWLQAFGAVLLLLCFEVRPAHAVAITLGSRIDLAPGTFALPIEIVDAIEVSEWFLDLTYDPTDVQVNVGCDPFGGDIYCSLLTGPVTEGDFFAAGAPFNLLVPGFVELDPGTFAQSGRLFGMHGAFGGSPPAPSGNGILAYIEFILLGTGDSPIEPGGTVLPEPEPDPVAVPEPGTLALLVTGLVWIGGRHLFIRGRRRRSPGSSAMTKHQHSLLFAARRRAAVLTSVALASLCTGTNAIAQAPPLVIDLPEDLPVLMPAPTGGYPPTVAPTAAAPYFVPPVWSHTLAPNVRFVILSNFNSDAVLDRETGLVWTRSTVAQSTVYQADQKCRELIVGNRMGWRLPAVAELQSLVDASLPASFEEHLPVGHPFLVNEGLKPTYWTSETHYTSNTLYRRWVGLHNGGAGSSLYNFDNDSPRGVVCVRGPEPIRHAEHP